MPSLWKSRFVQIVVSVGLAAALAVLFLRQVRLAELREALRSVSVPWLTAAALVALFTFLIRAVRWTWILKPVGRVGVMPAFQATCVGFAGNNLPGKVGEVLRPAFLARRTGLPFSPLLASIVLERVLDGFSVVVFFAVALAAGLPRAGGLGQLALPAVFIVLAGVVMTLAVFQRARTEAVLDVFWRRLPERVQPKARSFASSFIDGFAPLKDPKLFLLVFAGSLVMWFVINVQLYLLFIAFHVSAPIWAAFVVTTFAVLGLMVPTPGGLGSYHLAVQFALTYFYRIPVATASAVALLAHAISFVPVTILGIAFLISNPARATENRGPATADRGPKKQGS